MEQLKQIAASEPAKKVYSLWDEYKKFAFKGHVVDLAVGVVIGTAFANIINSLVKSVIMPLIAVVMPGDQSYATWKWTINGQDIAYGQFLAEFVNFLLLAGLLFLFVVKFLGWMVQAKKDETVPPTRQEELLMEIRDLLKQQAAPPSPPAAT